MKVVFTPEAFNQPAGGISRVFSELASRLPTLGCETVIFAGLYINEYIRDRSVVGRYTPRFPRLARAAVNTIAAQSYIACSEAAIVHQTYYSGHRYSRRKPLVISVYDMIHELFPELLATSGTVRATHVNKAECCQRAQHICAISHQTKEDLVRLLSINPDKISVTSLGNALKGVSPSEIGADSKRKFLLYVGNRRWHKNFLPFLSAYAESQLAADGVQLICFGGGPWDTEEDEAIQRLGVREQVHRRSGGDESLLGYYQQATAFVAPSLYEGFGLTVVEAMGAGCPVICSDTGIFREVAGEAAAFFDPTDIFHMRDQLDRIVQDSDRLKVLRAAGLQRELEFSWDRCARETLAAYRKVSE